MSSSSSSSSSSSTATAPSKGEMLAAQETLPSMPLPSLEDTCALFLRSTRPLFEEESGRPRASDALASPVSGRSYEEFATLVEDFAKPGGFGEELQAKLVQRAAQSRNWLEEWWEEFAYMRPRYPNAVNVNYYAALFGAEPFQGSRGRETAAALGAWYVARFQQTLAREELPGERMAKRPLCMNQFTRMFGECRIPGEPKDELRVYERTRHVVVLLRNQMFAFDMVRRRSGAGAGDAAHAFEVLSPHEILHQLRRVVQCAGDEAATGQHEPVSMFTGSERTQWARARGELLSLDPCNRRALEYVQTALFCVVLDEAQPRTADQLSAALLHGDGHNRWFDKSVQVVAFRGGRVGLNCEHSFGDAMVVVSMRRWFQGVLDREGASRNAIQDCVAPADLLPDSLPQPLQLRWKLNQSLRQQLDRARDSLTQLVENVRLHVLQFRGHGKNFVKSTRNHPDFWMQIALQLAGRRTFGRPVATYETGHTRLFFHGRTETVRSCSTEAQRFVDAMIHPEHTTEVERFHLFEGAMEAHKQYIMRAITGKAIDRHLLGLR
jgi:Choline/Carnitine o-acyltransferase